jgi:hypothetical protein
VTRGGPGGRREQPDASAVRSNPCPTSARLRLITPERHLVSWRRINLHRLRRIRHHRLRPPPPVPLKAGSGPGSGSGPSQPSPTGVLTCISNCGEASDERIAVTVRVLGDRDAENARLPETAVIRDAANHVVTGGRLQGRTNDAPHRATEPEGSWPIGFMATTSRPSPQHRGCCPRRGEVPDRHGAVQRTVARFLRGRQGARGGCGRRAASVTSVAARARRGGPLQRGPSSSAVRRQGAIAMRYRAIAHRA